MSISQDKEVFKIRTRDPLKWMLMIMSFIFTVIVLLMCKSLYNDSSIKVPQNIEADFSVILFHVLCGLLSLALAICRDHFRNDLEIAIDRTKRTIAITQESWMGEDITAVHQFDQIDEIGLTTGYQDEYAGPCCGIAFLIRVNSDNYIYDTADFGLSYAIEVIEKIRLFSPDIFSEEKLNRESDPVISVEGGRVAIRYSNITRYMEGSIKRVGPGSMRLLAR